ncbi:MAG: hypothetical protein ACLT16_08440 [[Clostridium] innocuum]
MKNRRVIPGIRPGTETKEYVTVLYQNPGSGSNRAPLSLFCRMHCLDSGINLPQSMGIGGTGIIIVVGGNETVKQIEGRLTQKHHGFLQR